MTSSANDERLARFILETRPEDLPPTVLAMADRIELVEDEGLSQRFPAERLARVTIGLHDGERFESPVLPARGDAERPLSDAEILHKFRAIVDSSPWADRAAEIVDLVASLDEAADVSALLAAVTAAPRSS